MVDFGFGSSYRCGGCDHFLRRIARRNISLVLDSFIGHIFFNNSKIFMIVGCCSCSDHWLRLGVLFKRVSNIYNSRSPRRVLGGVS